MSIEGWYVVLFIVCMVFSAFFSSSETAFISIQRYRLEHLLITRVPGSERVSRMVAKPERLLSTVLFGNTLVNTAAASVGTALAVLYWGEHGLIYATVAITVILLVFCEITPKTFAARHSERTALAFAGPLSWLTWFLTPLVWLLSWIPTFLNRAMGGHGAPRTLASPEEIQVMISIGHREGTVNENEAKLLRKVFAFGDRPVREVMVPRPEVVAVPDGSLVVDFLKLYTASPLSRFPVYRENMDTVVGTLAVKDVLMGLARREIDGNSPINDIVRPAYFAPETKPIDETFVDMRENNFRMCIVVDEFGGTAGVASLSRLVEDIVGEVGDELAGVEKDYEIINDYTFQIDGSMRVEEANEEMGLGIPDGDYETAAGFILNLLRHIPMVKESVTYKGLRFRILKMKGHKIEKMIVIKERQAREARRATRQKSASGKMEKDNDSGKNNKQNGKPGDQG